MSFIIVYITFPSEAEAKSLSSHLVTKKIAACGNIFPITSSYWWKGSVQNDDEWVAIVKTTQEYWERLVEEVNKKHSYEVPCIMKIEVSANESYEAWIRSCLIE